MSRTRLRLVVALIAFGLGGGGGAGARQAREPTSSTVRARGLEWQTSVRRLGNHRLRVIVRVRNLGADVMQLAKHPIRLGAFYSYGAGFGEGSADPQGPARHAPEMLRLRPGERATFERIFPPSAETDHGLLPGQNVQVRVSSEPPYRDTQEMTQADFDAPHGPVDLAVITLTLPQTGGRPRIEVSAPGAGER
jgi:hypothetical protein